jgi:hypothetical protein
MPTTPIYALPYPAAADPADVPLDMQELADQVAKVLGGALSATPPATPIEGQLWAMSPAAGVVWLFRYNAGSPSAYKWEFIGGPGLYIYDATDRAFANTTLGDLPGGAELTYPRPGDYHAHFQASVYHSGAVGSAMSFRLGNSTLQSAEEAILYNFATNYSLHVGLEARIANVAAASLLRIRVSTTASAGHIRYLSLGLVPIRLS